MMRLMAPSLPAVSRPSNSTTRRWPLATTHSCRYTSSVCRRSSSFSYCFWLSSSRCAQVRRWLCVGLIGHHWLFMSSRAVKTEAVVLRSMRYGEADRILHLYTPARGRVSAIAKGVRRARSRFGGRLEPFFRLQHGAARGRGELLTVTGAQTVDGYARLRGDARALDAAARACDAVGRLFETSEPHPGVFNLLCRQLALLDAGRAAEPGAGPRPAAACGRRWRSA